MDLAAAVQGLQRPHPPPPSAVPDTVAGPQEAPVLQQAASAAAAALPNLPRMALASGVPLSPAASPSPM